VQLKNQVQLITYADSLGGDLPALRRLLAASLAGLFGGIHILPFFPSSGDRGFGPITYFEVEPSFGTWEDIRCLGEEFELVADLMVNHLSRRSPYFQDVERAGRRSPYADLFITLDKIWPDGRPVAGDVEKLMLRRPQGPFSDFTIQETGEIERIWTTFGREDPSEQIDLDVRSPATRELLTGFVRHLAEKRITIVRLDAVGYVIKKPGTSCFFVEPEIYEFMGWMRKVAHEFGVEILPEVHAPHPVQGRLAAHGYWVYDFVLPMLILHTLRGTPRSSLKLQHYLRACPRRQFTMLDCHDGIPVQPDLDGVLDVDESRQIVDRLVRRGANVNPLLSRHMAAGDFDAHQVNCTYYSALDGDDDAYLAARAIQFFAPGIPQVYYVGLLAGRNDHAAVQATGEGRAINRHDYSLPEIENDLKRPVVQRLLRLIRFRNEYPAFGGDLRVVDTPGTILHLEWQHGEAICTLHVDLAGGAPAIDYRDPDGHTRTFRV
jgi:sucrose phosphorylase